tara:strand:+ start:98 stop:244 length:147 start_codon:yes stop_codon:yes gene_type:complete
LREEEELLKTEIMVLFLRANMDRSGLTVLLVNMEARKVPVVRMVVVAV